MAPFVSSDRNRRAGDAERVAAGTRQQLPNWPPARIPLLFDRVSIQRARIEDSFRVCRAVKSRAKGWFMRRFRRPGRAPDLFVDATWPVNLSVRRHGASRIDQPTRRALSSDEQVGNIFRDSRRDSDAGIQLVDNVFQSPKDRDPPTSLRCVRASARATESSQSPRSSSCARADSARLHD